MIDDMVDIGLVLLRGCRHCMTYTKFLFYDTLLSCSSLRELIILWIRGCAWRSDFRNLDGALWFGL